MSDITIFINDKEYKVDSSLTIMQAADLVGYHIPRLCYHPKLSIEGACRVCIVEVEGARSFVASCAAPVAEGMKVYTNTAAVRKARRDIVELILDNHPTDCHTCERDGDCELQRLASSVGIKDRLYEGETKSYERDDEFVSIVRNANKCVLCGRCVRMCAEVQKVTNLGVAFRGFESVVMPAYNNSMADSPCAACGQCINVCPTAAFLENSKCSEIFEMLNDSDIVKVAHVAPAVRAAIGESFELEPGTEMEGQIFASLKNMGFDYVFDTNFSADLTIMEEGSELIHRLNTGGVLPLITSCSPGWIKYMEHFYPEMIDNISTCKSPMSMASSLIKSYFAEKIGVSPEKIMVVSVMPCTAKKFEASRPELDVNGVRATDYVVTTRELAWMIKSAGIDFVNIDPIRPDDPLGRSTGAAPIFGTTGGVMEAALRTAYEIVTGETLSDVNFNAVRGLEGIREATVKVGDLDVNVAIAHGLGNAAQLMEHVKDNPGKYHFVEVMACPGGCIGGGGQPYAGIHSEPLNEEILTKRASVLYTLDANNPLRKSHENPDIQKLYKEYLGEPLSHRSHELLHTSYRKRGPVGVVPTELVSSCG